MRIGVGAALMSICLLSCTPATEGATPSPSVPPSPASREAVSPYTGSYAASDGDVIVVARMGWFFDVRNGAYRTIYSTNAPGHFTIGSRFLEPLPKFADLRFGSGTLDVIEPAGKRTARRIDYRQTEVVIPTEGARLAGTVTEPLGAGPHPGIVVVHGSEPGQRFFYDIWVGVYAGMGLAVLTYDKRGNGASTGTYPGEFATTAALTTYADDAAAALAFLAQWPGVDPHRVGFHGGSQGGWTVPLAMQRHPHAAFAVLVSAPATTVDQTDLWASYSVGGSTMPTETTDQMLAAVRNTRTGYDPASALQALEVRALWLLGANDRTVPTAICVEILGAMHKPNFTVHILPTGHGLLVNPTGLLADDDRSRGLAPELVPTLKEWLAQT